MMYIINNIILCYAVTVGVKLDFSLTRSLDIHNRFADTYFAR